MTSPIYVAIDTPDLRKAQELAQQVRHHVGGLKLGLEFFCAHGHHGVHEMMKFGLPIFLDLKLHDIPNTVAKAVQALSQQLKIPLRQYQQRPHAIGNGTTTRSPFFSFLTERPTSTTSPMNSWPRTSPFCIVVT